MPLFTPTIVFERITCITPEFLGARGLRALILDVDNTLTAHGSQELPPDVAAWLDTMRAAGVKLTIASNNMPGRVAPFAKRVGLEYQAFCCKPSPFGLRRGAPGHGRIPARGGAGGRPDLYRRAGREPVRHPGAAGAAHAAGHQSDHTPETRA